MLLRGFWTVLATAFVFAVIGISMAMNLAFGYSLGTDPANARMLAGLSVACDGLKSLLPLFIAWQWAERHRLAAFAATLLFVLLLAYGAASAIGFAAENGMAMASGREGKKAGLDESVADLAAAEARRAGLPAHRLRGVVEAEISALQKDAIWDLTKGCSEATRPASREFCKKIDSLKGELAVAREAGTLAGRIDSLKADIRKAREAGAGREADPQARAIARLASLDAAHVRAALAWLLALVVEAISAFGLFAITRRRREGRGAGHEPWRLVSRGDAAAALSVPRLPAIILPPQPPTSREVDGAAADTAPPRKPRSLPRPPSQQDIQVDQPAEGER
jgi:hypothetical protein